MNHHERRAEEQSIAAINAEAATHPSPQPEQAGTETPETDAESLRVYGDEKTYEESYDVAIAAWRFARSLERRLRSAEAERHADIVKWMHVCADVVDERKAVEEALATAHARIVELEKALERIESNDPEENRQCADEVANKALGPARFNKGSAGEGKEQK